MYDRIMQFRDEYSFLSNMYHTEVRVLNIPYNNAEAAFQASKITDLSARRQFSSLTGKQAKALGKTVELRADWNICRLEVMELVLRSKFRNPDLAMKLVATGDKELVEGNYWGDKYWGYCLKTNEGSNVLGRMLMLIRSEL